MSVSTVIETTKFFRSYGVKCDANLVEEWLSATSRTDDVNNNLCEEALYDFNEWCRWEGTAYEEGIDDQTKIARLLEEVNDLMSEISTLKKDKANLQLQLGIEPF